MEWPIGEDSYKKNFINMNIKLSDTMDIPKSSIVSLYKANKWSSADKPDILFDALMGSHSLVSAWEGEHLVGIGMQFRMVAWWFITRTCWYIPIITAKVLAA